MAQFLPLLAMGIPALLSGVSGIMDIVGSAKKLHDGSGRMRRRRARGLAPMNMKRPYCTGGRMRRRGRGVVSDVVSKIPILGSLLGPLIASFGGSISNKKLMMLMNHQHKMMSRHMRGRGLAPMRIRRSFASRCGGRVRKMHHKRRAGMLSAPGGMRRLMGYGLLSPAGGTIRRGHYRKVGGKRVHVRATIIPRGSGRIRRARRRGGYMPYRWRS